VRRGVTQRVYFTLVASATKKGARINMKKISQFIVLKHFY